MNEVPIEVKLEASNKRVEELEKLCVLFARIERNNDRLSEQLQIMLKGLHEIEQIKGKPPIQVARTIATRTIGEVASHIVEYVTKDHEEESANNNSIHTGDSIDSKDSEHEAGDIPGRTV